MRQCIQFISLVGRPPAFDVFHPTYRLQQCPASRETAVRHGGQLDARWFDVSQDSDARQKRYLHSGVKGGGGVAGKANSHVEYILRRWGRCRKG